MVEIFGLKKSFGTKQILKGIDVSFPGGSVVSLIGPNAAGKTTLIKCFLGMVKPDEGRIVFMGNTLNNDWAYRGQIGYMPQISRFPDQMKVGKLFELMEEVRGMKGVDYSVYEVFELEKIRHSKLGSLSGGTRQKVSAALAFLFNPEVLVLDEPTAGLDPISTEKLKLKILEAKDKGKLILITTHNLGEVEELSDSIVFLNEGKIGFQKSPEEIKIETGREKMGAALAEYLKYGNHE